MTWQQSICLIDIHRDGRCILVGKADVLETYEATVSSPSVTLEIPAVIRLRSEIQLHKKGVKFSRSNVLARDRFTCCYCGEKKKPRELNYDHVVPRHQGGKTTWTNIVSACFKCNGRKANRTPQQAGMRMHYQPHQPKSLPMSQPMLFAVDSVPEQWSPYLDSARATAV